MTHPHAVMAKQLAAVTFAIRDSTQAAFGSNTNPSSITTPTGAVVGDRLILIAHKPTATADLGDPTGFTLVTENPAGSDRDHMWTRVVDGTEGGTLTGPTRDVSTSMILFALLFPACTIENADQTSLTSAAASIVTGSIGAPSAPALTVIGGGTNAGTDVFTAPAGYTIHEQAAGGGVAACAVVADALNGSAPGVVTITRSGSSSAQKGLTWCNLVPS